MWRVLLSAQSRTKNEPQYWYESRCPDKLDEPKFSLDICTKLRLRTLHACSTRKEIQLELDVFWFLLKSAQGPIVCGAAAIFKIPCTRNIPSGTWWRYSVCKKRKYEYSRAMSFSFEASSLERASTYAHVSIPKRLVLLRLLMCSSAMMIH